VIGHCTSHAHSQLPPLHACTPLSLVLPLPRPGWPKASPSAARAARMSSLLSPTDLSCRLVDLSTLLLSDLILSLLSLSLRPSRGPERAAYQPVGRGTRTLGSLGHVGVLGNGHVGCGGRVYGVRGTSQIANCASACPSLCPPSGRLEAERGAEREESRRQEKVGKLSGRETRIERFQTARTHTDTGGILGDVGEWGGGV